MNEEVFDRRWDLTKELKKDTSKNRWKRRLDSLARILEGGSGCAAVAIDDDQFIIATNLDLITDSKNREMIMIK
jgi:hypothetical protein